MHVLTHLAEIGTPDIHPLGAAASTQLIRSLDVRAGHRVLEVGCGTGQTLQRLLTAHDITLIGIDGLPEMLRAARQRLRWLGVGIPCLVRGDAQALPFTTRSFHRVYMESVLGFQSMDAARRMLAEVYRALKPDGLLVANEAVWKPGVTAETAAEIYRTSLEDFGICQASEQPWSCTDWEAQMRSAGFHVLSSELLSTRHAPSADNHNGGVSAGVYRAYHAVRKRVLPRLRQEREKYRRLSLRHVEDGKYIEARLFVLRKPRSSG